MALTTKRQTTASVSRDGCAERESLSEEDMIRTSMEKLSEVVRLLQAEVDTFEKDLQSVEAELKKATAIEQEKRYSEEEVAELEEQRKGLTRKLRIESPGVPHQLLYQAELVVLHALEIREEGCDQPTKAEQMASESPDLSGWVKGWVKTPSTRLKGLLLLRSASVCSRLRSMPDHLVCMLRAWVSSSKMNEGSFSSPALQLLYKLVCTVVDCHITAAGSREQMAVATVLQSDIGLWMTDIRVSTTVQIALLLAF